MDDRSNVVEAVFAQKRSGDPDAEEYQAMSYGRVGNRPQLTLLARKASGELQGFAYADWDSIHTRNEDLGFTVTFGRRILRVEGRNLRELFRYVCSFRAAEIKEIDASAAMQIAEDKPVVWSLSFMA